MIFTCQSLRTAIRCFLFRSQVCSLFWPPIISRCAVVFLLNQTNIPQSSCLHGPHLLQTVEVWSNNDALLYSFFPPPVIMYIPTFPWLWQRANLAPASKRPNKASCRVRQLLQNTLETSKRHYQFVRNGNISLQPCRNTSSWCWQLRCTSDVWSVQKRKSRSPHSKWTLPEETLSAVLLWAYKYYLALLILVSVLHPDGACVRNLV